MARYHEVGNGKNSWFWLDLWIGDTPLSITFHGLYVIATDCNIIVEDVWVPRHCRPLFHCSLGKTGREQWHRLATLMSSCSLSSTLHTFGWKLERLGYYLPTRSTSIKALLNSKSWMLESESSVQNQDLSLAVDW